jgi:predicted ATP-dependent serine protease
MLPRERTPAHLQSHTLRCPTHAQLQSGPRPAADSPYCQVPHDAARECQLDMLSGAKLDQLARAPFLPTGAPAFDTLLAGGLRRGEVTELTGAPASGKTQVRRRQSAWCVAHH